VAQKLFAVSVRLPKEDLDLLVAIEEQMCGLSTRTALARKAMHIGLGQMLEDLLNRSAGPGKKGKVGVLRDPATCGDLARRFRRSSSSD